jgi:hypothetical protein
LVLSSLTRGIIVGIVVVDVVDAFLLMRGVVVVVVMAVVDA